MILFGSQKKVLKPFDNPFLFATVAFSTENYMNILFDLCPEFNEQTLKWEVRETDEKDNTLEVYSFDTEEQAEKFIDEWIEKKENESEQMRRDEKNGLYPDKIDDCN